MLKPNLLPSLSIIALLFLFACKNQGEIKSTSASEPKATTGQPAFQQKTVEKKIGNCETDDTCLEVLVTYPILTGVAANIQQKINNSIIQEVVTSMEIEKEIRIGPFVIDSAAQQWVNSYQEYLSEGLDFRTALTYQCEGEGFIYKNYAITELPVSTYTGGAHPNYLVLLSNYNLKTGVLIEMEDLITDKAGFNKVVENAFSKAIKEKDQKTDRSEYFWDKPFYLPANFSITDKGLYFIYNPYEVAAYVYGSTEFTVPYEDLKELIKLP